MRRGTVASVPRLAREWHPTRNAPLSPHDLTLGSARRVWWKCPEGSDHVWQVPVVNRSRGAGCPYCSGHRVSKTTSLAVRHPALAREWHPTRNAPLSPRDVTTGTPRRVWWVCREGRDHVWRTSVAARVHGTGCPFCAGRRVAKSNSLAARYPALARQWHPTRNGALRASDVMPNSKRRVWWKCPEGPDHQWRTSPYARVTYGNGCPFCSRHRLAKGHSLSAEYPTLARQWHPTRNGTLRPTQVSRGSTKRVWWKCPKGPDHEWEAVVFVRALEGTGCPFCRGLRVSVTNSLAKRFPALARQWHPTKNGNLRPEDVTYGSSRRVFWQCVSGHSWAARVGGRTARGTGCPICYELSHRRRKRKRKGRRYRMPLLV
jgi:hypothetical protein